MDQKLHIEVEFLQLRVATTNKLTIIIHNTNIPNAFASSDPDADADPDADPDPGTIQAPEVKT